MPFTRRSFVKRTALAAGALMTAPKMFLRTAAGAPGAGPRNLILVELFGGNDGFNTVVPYGVDGGTYYSEFRKKLAVRENRLLAIDDQVAFHPSLTGFKSLFDAGELGIVQGVSYPNPDFSHEQAGRIWASGDPTGLNPSGWFGRVLERRNGTAFPECIDATGAVGMIVSGSGKFVPSVESIESFRFPVDGDHWDDGDARRAAYEAIANQHVGSAGPLGAMGQGATGLLGLIDTFQSLAEFNHVGNYPDEYFSDVLKMVPRILAGNLGTRFFHVGIGGFDTHARQDKDDHHANLLATTSGGIAALQADLVAGGYADDTLIVVYSEFGRTVYENGSDGTDHGTVNPVFVIGKCANGGVHSEHPSMNPALLTEEEEPAMVVDFRDVFGTVVADWLGDDPDAIFPGYGLNPLPLIRSPV